MSAAEAVRGIAQYADPAWYTPSGLPSQLTPFDTPVPTLAVGSAGKVGILDLTLAPAAGTTRVVQRFQQLPLYFFHPVYIDPGRPDMAFLYLLQAGDGPVQGDRLRLDLTCAPGAAVHVTTQAATKIYKMVDNFATQIVNLDVGAGAYLEYLPDPVIPFRDARFYQRLHLTVDDTASAIVGETLLPGRVAHGEAHAYTLYYTDLEVTTPSGALLFADRIVLEPPVAPVQSPGRLGSYDVLATLYVVSRQVPPADLVAALREALAIQDAVLAGVSTLPNDCGVAVRLLGPTSRAVKHAVELAWNSARRMLIATPAPDLRKG